MFGKEQIEIVDDEDVGAFIEELRRQGAGEVQEFIEDEPVGSELVELVTGDFAELEEKAAAMSSVDELKDMAMQRSRMRSATFVDTYGTSGKISRTVHNTPIQSACRDLLVQATEAEEAGNGMAQSSTDASGRGQNTD